jgi:DNA-binding transcriptional MerR regulator
MSLFIFFTLEEATQLIGLKPADKWRVVNFAQGKEYGIKPSVRDAAGSGSRRLYELNDVCELQIALRLLETGLRPMVIGQIVDDLRDAKEKGGLTKVLDSVRGGATDLQLAVIRTPRIGMALDRKRDQIVVWVRNIEDAEKLRRTIPDSDLILVPVGKLFSEFQRRLEANLKKKG